MPLIPITLHNVIDYVAGAVLLMLPPLLGLPAGTASVTLQLVGAATIIVSLLTAYRFSILKLVPFGIHLMLDVALGLLMLLVGFFTLAEGLAAILLIVAGLIYVVVPALSWQRRAPEA